MANLTPLHALRVSSKQIAAYRKIPNTSLQQKPLMVYHSAFQQASAAQIESHLTKIGVVTPQWRYTMYSDTHFHSTSHEVLVVAAGSARCCFGGEENESRYEPVLQTGDVIIVPAGVGHRLLEDYGGFQMVGSYPAGFNWDMCYGRDGEDKKIEAIEKLEWFKQDPIYGANGPSLHV